jgi:hypothetical protein
MSLVPIDEVVHIPDVTTHDPTTGAVTDADSAPTFDVFEEATDTPILSAQTMTKRTSKTGDYRGVFTASAANGFEAGKWYNVVVSGTVGGIAAKKAGMHFRVAPAEVTAGVPVGDLSAPAVALIWDEPASGHVTAGTFGDKFRAHQAAVLKVVVGAGSTTTAVVLNSSTGIEGAAPSSVNDHYNGRVVLFISGTLAGQATAITDYVGSTKTLTVVALTSAPSAGDLAILV